MKIVIAPDSFKGSLSSNEVSTAIKTGLKKIFPEASYTSIPMADGGEGTMDALVQASNGTYFTEKILDPLNHLAQAKWGLLGDKKTAIIEMAQASGLQFVNSQTANPLKTSTFGTGQLIKKALDHGVNKIIIGLGGSATNDAGSGMTQALGAHFLDKNGDEVKACGGNLNLIQKIDLSNLDDRLAKTAIILACDVSNSLIGANGASYVFGPQKGASNEMVELLDKNLTYFSDLVKKQLHKDYAFKAGAGAAGGLGYGLMVFANAKIQSGVETVLKYTNFAKKVQDADFVFTGEGASDYQTQFGKTPFGVAKLSKRITPNCSVICLTGNMGTKIDELYGKDKIDAIFTTETGAKELRQAMKDSFDDIAIVSENIARLIKSIR
ncbi:glycerate kinase [Lactobacillus hominis]|uniref:Glycerate kinase n=1 Tax=Lactobacillus hominis DSM 23910 = CRBIP 24.179 TaxID=1423758 RepID=I7L539_9LACO|nr:glycerate kinase [Lactobacillus hominis]KRM85400.1 glycerate kinase [Lactobacillus hominis DSM 23910 = CRBIP 24.179]MCT3347522.1 glycerate kinase [Lactobacillus hominis]CCI81182.1 Glycerate kinase [Lactobacillus hominis DSM 23910 = CRBIP 24.179]